MKNAAAPENSSRKRQLAQRRRRKDGLAVGGDHHQRKTRTAPDAHQHEARHEGGSREPHQAKGPDDRFRNAVKQASLVISSVECFFHGTFPCIFGDIAAPGEKLKAHCFQPKRWLRLKATISSTHIEALNLSE